MSLSKGFSRISYQSNSKKQFVLTVDYDFCHYQEDI